MPRLCSSLLLSLLIASSAPAVTMEWTFVGEPGNACNPGTQLGCRGTVAYGYFIGTYEVTNAQFAEFLNAKGASGGLYSAVNGSPASPGFVSITRSGVVGSYTYGVVAGREDMPVGWVSPYTAARFANWMHNGQGNGDTETGAYTITIGSSGQTLTRSPNARFALPSSDEWYKAAFYDAASASYFDYITGSNAPTVCAAPGPTPNTANCLSAAGGPTIVGSYTGSASPYGTFDQGGNVFEWAESGGSQAHLMYGGSYNETLVPMTSEFDYYYVFPFASDPSFGFRLVMIPEPGTGLLVIAGLVILARRRAAS